MRESSAGPGALALNVLFAGTPEFAAVCLRAVVESSHAVVGVLTQPDRPAGRGLAQTQSPVKRLAMAGKIAVAQPAKLSDPEFLDRLLASRQPDIIALLKNEALRAPASFRIATRAEGVLIAAAQSLNVPVTEWAGSALYKPAGAGINRL